MEVIQKVLCAVTALCMLAGCALSQAPSGGGGGGGGRTPVTRFTCQGRPAGYYADVDTGCQVYHMCDGLGRQFSYTCPNTTLFQQRMLVCDHWYMVNCSKAESDYDANLLIGQRDKPFVSEQEMHLRTPRPDILTVPYNHNYYDGLKQAETKYPAHPGNGIVTSPDSTATGGDGALDGGKTGFTPPTHTNQHHGTSNDIEDHHFHSSTRPPVHVGPSRRTPIDQQGNFGDRTDYNTQQSTVNLQYTSSTVRTTDAEDSDEFEIDIRMKSEERPTTSFDFIKRFDPNSAPNTAPNSGSNSHGTAMTTSQILDINRQLPAGSDVSSEDTGRNSRRKPAISQNNFNTFQTDSDKHRPTPSTIFRTANTKPINEGDFGQHTPTGTSPDASVPDRLLQPPKTSYPNLPSTTMGPPIYYEWKWAVPAFDLAPPKADNVTRNSTDSALQASESGRPTFRNYTRPSSATPRSLDPSTSSSSSSTPRPEYNPSSYFVPDYIFPLDNPHPGYKENGAQTSFQVSVPEKGRSYGENPNCPQCHPAYLKPGTCEPCIVQR